MPNYGKSGGTGSGTGRSRKKMGVHDALYAKAPTRSSRIMPRRPATGGAATGGATRSTMPKSRAGGYGKMSRSKAEQMGLRPRSGRAQTSYKQTGTTAAVDEAYYGFGRGSSARLVGNSALAGTRNAKGMSVGSSRAASIARSNQVATRKRSSGKGTRKGMR